MPRIVVFDEGATPQRVVQITGRSENQGPWDDSGRTDFIVDPDLSLLATEDADGKLTYIIPRRDWKHSAGAIIEWAQAEKDARASAEAAAQAAADIQNIAIIRAEAAAGLDNFDVTPLLLRAFADIIKDEINILRAEHGLADRTLAQLRSAITAKVNDGTVDS